ncbi:hypothetical protein ACFSJQ_20550 [Vibrio olivae]
MSQFFCEEIDTNNLIKGLVKHVAQRGALAEYYALDLSERSQFTEDEEREKNNGIIRSEEKNLGRKRKNVQCT